MPGYVVAVPAMGITPMPDETQLSRFGLHFGRGGTHSSRTMMLDELTELLDYVNRADATKADYLHAIEEDNCLGKRSGKTRRLTYKHLVELYSLDTAHVLFRALLYFWKRDEAGRLMLALLATYARDPIFRSSAPMILKVLEGAVITREFIEELIDSLEPGRFSKATLKSTAQNINSSWTNSGHLTGRNKKICNRAVATAGSAAYALLLGYLTGAHWQGLFRTKYAKLLDCSREQVIELADEQRAWVKRCEALLPFADKDGIVCIPPVRAEASAADRLLNLLAAAYGETWSNEILAELLKSADHTGKTLETWLQDKFFTQHCKLFHHRPFIWHIWDGLRDGFSVLVNYHKLDRKNLETLIYTYLGDWISRQKQDQNNGIDGAEERLAAAESLKKKLELILEGEAPYDIFVRWKPIEQQPIGWDPDLNDGVRLNIRPFMSVPMSKRKAPAFCATSPISTGKKTEVKTWSQCPGTRRLRVSGLMVII